MKKELILISKIILSIGILYYLFKQISFDALLKQYSKLNIYILIIPIVILLFQCALSSLKWKCILTAEDIFVPYMFLLKSYLIGNFISLFLPSSFGGDIYRVYALKNYNPDSFQNISSVLFDRITGLFALVSISIITYALFYGNIINYKFSLSTQQMNNSKIQI